MTIYYVDTSVLGRIYLGDQSDSGVLAETIYRGDAPAVTAALTDVEIASTLARARRDGAIDTATEEALAARYTADTADNGPIGICPAEDAWYPRARDYVRQAAVRSLDALHLAACTLFAESIGQAETVELLSRDRRQIDAAHTLGIPVAEA